jgi:hypothetical protein
MDIILASNHYSPAEIRKLNFCRLFLNVITLSDISHPYGLLFDLSFPINRLQEPEAVAHIWVFIKIVHLCPNGSYGGGQTRSGVPLMEDFVLRLASGSILSTIKHGTISRITPIMFYGFPKKRRRRIENTRGQIRLPSIKQPISIPLSKLPQPTLYPVTVKSEDT